MKKFCSGLLLLFCLNSAVAVHPDQQDIDFFLQQHRLPADSLTLITLPLAGNPHPEGVSYNDGRSVNPASLAKLVTTYAALELLGPNYSWQARLLTDGEQSGNSLNGNLYFNSGGDPKLGIERLWLLLRELKLQGIEHINGDLILDDSFYISSAPPGYQGQQQDRFRPFMVEAGNLLLNFNSQHFRVNATAQGAQIIANPPLNSVSINNQVKVGAKASCNGNIKVVYHPEFENGVASMRISGSLPLDCSTGKYFALLPHELYASQIINNIWQELGGSISGHTRVGSAPEQARLLASLPSVSLSAVISDINKYSSNSMAKQLFLSIGAWYRGADSIDDQQTARQTIRNWWISKGLEVSQLNIDNGSGLSQSATLNARQLANMLVKASQSPFYPEFAASLPIVAIDGTMRERLKNRLPAGRARIKTGTLRNVRAAAGYIQDKDGNDWAVVAIINHEQAKLRLDVLDSLLETLYLQQAAGH